MQNKNNFKIQNLNHFQKVIHLQIISSKMNNQIMNRQTNIQIKILTNQNQFYKTIIFIAP